MRLFFALNILITPAVAIAIQSDELTVDGESDRQAARQEIDDWVDKLALANGEEVSAQFATIADDYVATEIAHILLQKGIHQADAAVQIIARDHDAARSDEPGPIDFNDEVRKKITPRLLAWLLEADIDRAAKAQACLERLPDVPTEAAVQLRQMATGQHRYIRAFACTLIGRLSRISAEDLTVLETCLNDESGAVRRAAVEAGLEGNCVELLDAILERESDPSYTVQIAVARAVNRLDVGRKYTPEKLLEEIYLSDDRRHVRSEVAGVMIEFAPHVLNASGLLLGVLDADSVQLGGVHFKYEASDYMLAIAALEACGDAAVPVIGTWLDDSRQTARVRKRLLAFLVQADWEISDLRPCFQRLAASEDSEIRSLAIFALDRCGRVDADFVSSVLAEDLQVEYAAAVALGKSTSVTRATAVNALRELMEHQSPFVRIAAVRSFQQQNGDRETIVKLLGEILSQLNSAELSTIDDNDSKILADCVRNLRPSPPELVERVLQIGKDEHPAQGTFRLLAAFDESAIDARVQLLNHPRPDIRAGILYQIGLSDSDRSFEILKQQFNNKENFSVTSADRYWGEQELRFIALDTLTNPVRRPKELVPILVDRLSEDWSRRAAIEGLAQCGDYGRMALPELYVILRNAKTTSEGVAAALAIARLEPVSADRVQALKIILSTLPLFQEREGTFYDRNCQQFVSGLVQLHRDGVNLQDLRPEIVRVAVQRPAIYRWKRIAATYLLAVTESDNPNWQKMLEGWAKAEDFEFDQARHSLRQLAESR